MSGNLHEQPSGSDPQRQPFVRVPRRTWVVWLVILLGILLLMLIKEKVQAPGEILTQYQFARLVDSNRIARATVVFDPQNSAVNEIVGAYYKGENVEVPFRAKVRLTPGLEEKLFSLPQFEPRQPNTMVLSIVWSLLPILVIAILIWFFFIRQIRKVARSAPNTSSFQARTEEQQLRFDKLLDRWEQQASRLEALLDKVERDSGRPK
jgi:ATP-dependent Zn protease